MRAFLIILFLSILVAMLGITTWAGLDRPIFEAGGELMTYPWFIATLVDAYFGFITFYVWVAYRETSWGKRILWFVLVMLLGNIAMAIYMVLRLATWRSGKVADLLLRPATA